MEVVMNYYCLDCSKEFYLEDSDELVACPFCNSEDVEQLEDEEFDEEDYDEEFDEDVDEEDL